MEINIEHTNVFSRNLDAINNNVRNILNIGGTRSSKNISIIQLLIYLSLTEPGIICSIIRTSLPLLKKTAIKDFVKHMKKIGVYDASKHNLTEHRYMFDNGSEIKFLSCGDLKGIEHTYAYINEADEVAYEDFLEIKIRTQKSIIIDYNPSESDHWTYELRNQENSVVIHSTYLDNVFLPDAQVKEIEELIATDERAYKIYALGEYPAKEEKIYNHYKIVPDVPEYVRAKNNFVYGLDFGHSDPNALVKVWRHENEFWVEELLYKTGQDPNQLLESLDALGIDKKKPMLCDHRTDIIQLLRRAGYSALAANKLPIVQGIDFIRMNKFFVTMDSTNLKKELVGYSYKINRSTGQITDEPVDFNNHLLDAARYACVHYKNKGAGMMTSFRLL